jgi:predicted ATPase with chaperone activity
MKRISTVPFIDLIDLKMIKGLENIKRACEIAVVGHHSIAIVTVKGFGFSMLQKAYHNIDSEVCIQEYEQEKRDNYDIVVEMQREPFEKYFSDLCENSFVVQERIAKAKNFMLGKEPLSMNLDNQSKALLKNAFEKLYLSFKDINGILQISRTIATLDCEEHIKGIHIAEAIMYKNYKND